MCNNIEDQFVITQPLSLKIQKSPQKYFKIDLKPDGQFRVDSCRTSVKIIKDDDWERRINLKNYTKLEMTTRPNGTNDSTYSYLGLHVTASSCSDIRIGLFLAPGLDSDVFSHIEWPVVSVEDAGNYFDYEHVNRARDRMYFQDCKMFYII